MENMNITPVYQSIKDTIKIVGVSNCFLRKQLKNGNLPHIRSGNKIYVNVPSLISKLEKGEFD